MTNVKYFFSLVLLFILPSLIIILSGCKDDEENADIPPEGPGTIDSTYFPENTLPLLTDLQKRTVDYFWNEGSDGGVDPNTGMAFEGADRRGVVTSGGTGFGVMAVISGVERGWIARDDAADRMVKLVRFLGKAERFHGAWSHWMNPATGAALPWGGSIGGDLVETCLLMQGLLTARAYYNGSGAAETEVRDSITSFWETIEFDWFTNGQDYLHWSWYPAQNGQDEVFQLPVRGYNEAQITYILALASPHHGISSQVYQSGWLKNGDIQNSQSHYGYNLEMGPVKGGPMFLSHYSMLGMNPCKMADQYTNYWDHVVNHVMINRHYCVHAAPASHRYGRGVWGLTACYGPPEYGYSARNPNNDDGTIAPTAALASFPFTPFYSMEFMMHMSKNHRRMYGKYGFFDAFNIGFNWDDNRYLAIDQGPIAVMIENYRSGLFWDLLMVTPEVQLGLQKAGISLPDYETGFHLAVADTESGCYDLMMHPDKKAYNIDFYLKEADDVAFNLVPVDDGESIEIAALKNYSAGPHVLAFELGDIIPNETYNLVMTHTRSDIILKIKFH
ncbi:beta-glucosidase [Marinilabiliaceae bacterium JC017]|nr:beta-glucosidase [Marinilabiliaceae bacterium JC017]